MAAWRPQNRSNRENQKKALGVLPKGIRTPSFIEIAIAVTKHALLTDDDGRYVIAIANQRRAKFRMIRARCKKKLGETHFVFSPNKFYFRKIFV
jgi:hypothetical protein